MVSDALSLLETDEICVVLLRDGQRRNAFWLAEQRCFVFCDGALGYVLLEHVDEWWPESMDL